MHIIPFCVKNRAFNHIHSNWHQPQFEVLHTNALHANVYRTILRRFMQYISGIKHATQLGYQTHTTRAYDELRKCLIHILTRFK